MADRLGALARVLSVCALAGLAAACVARPVGDFGRAVPGFTHDTAMPAAGDFLARQRKEAVSNFNQTDQEKEMHNRVWRFLVAAHAKDWFYDTAVELQRTRIAPEVDTSFTIDLYYNWLRTTPYQSSRTRYATVGSHITSDIDTIPTTFASICAVIEVDRQRAVALAELGNNLPPEVGPNLAARKSENSAHINWFIRALTYRYQSYDFALDSLLVETPHEQSLAVDDALRRMSVYVQRANRRDFCGQGGPAYNGGDVVIPSRFQHTGDAEIVLPK